jgi:protein-S-isoprenylcysteine O-methyltransferase Ste14
LRTVNGTDPARSTRRMPGYSRRHRLIAAAYGAVCHSTFVGAITAMVIQLYVGLAAGRGDLRGPVGLFANAGLLLQFPLLHSLLLTGRGRGALARLAPDGLGADLRTTTYATVASLQLMATFVLWSPTGIVLWDPVGHLRDALTLAYGGAWILLLKAMHDAGLPLQTGFLGWGSVIRGRTPSFHRFPSHGLFAHTRQPVYVAFSLTLWTAPCWTLDRLVLTLGWTAYCVIGPLFKEHRYRRVFGADFDAYRDAVPYWIPRMRKDSST